MSNLQNNDNKITLKEIKDEYNEILNGCTKFLFLTRDSKLQAEKVKELTRFKERVKFYKYQIVKDGHEVIANTFFHFQCVLNAHISLLEMWIEIKRKKYHEAWNHLIESQMYTEYALQVEGNHYGINEFQQRLNDIERVIFPGFPLYNSPGLIISGGKCSVCGLDIDSCEHIEEKIYWGRVCKRLSPNLLNMDHSALVENPKDKRCIITEITTDDGFYQDYFTWEKKNRVEPSAKKERIIKSVIFNNKQLDIF